MSLSFYKIFGPVLSVLGCCLVSLSPCLAEQGLSIENTKIKDDNLLVELRCPDGSEILTEKDFSVYINELPVDFSLPVRASSSADNRLTYVVISVDASKSISQTLMTQIKKQVKLIIADKTEQDVVALYRFNDDIVLLNNFTRSRADLENRLDSVARTGTKTLLYNALFDSIDKLQKAHGSDKDLIVFTDGKDEGSNIGPDEIIALAKDARIKINFVAVKKFSENSIMEHIAENSGGKVWSINNVPNSLLKRLNALHNAGSLCTIKISQISFARERTTLDVRLKQGSKRYRAVESIILDPGKAACKDFKKVFILGGAVLVLVLALGLLGRYIFVKQKQALIAEKNQGNTYPARGRNFEPENVTDISSSSFPAPGMAWLMEKDGTDQGKKFPINGAELNLGRSRNNSIILQDSFVSMSHARIRWLKGEFYIFDLASEHGTALNGKKLLRPKPLNDWDEIEIGSRKFIFRAPPV